MSRLSLRSTTLDRRRRWVAGRPLRAAVIALAQALSACALMQQPAHAQPPQALELVPSVTIRDLMEKTIAPATNTIWAYYEAPTEASQWIELEEAAVTALAAASLTAAGGTGAMDAQWAADARWQAFAQIMLAAARDALAAVRSRDHAALLNAADALYPPCEGCHSAFHPDLVGDE